MIVCTSASAGVNGRCGLEPAAFESGSGGVRGSGSPAPRVRRDRDRARSDSGDAMPNANAQRQWPKGSKKRIWPSAQSEI